MPEASNDPECHGCGGPRDWRGVCPRCLIFAALRVPEPVETPATAMRLGQYTLLNQLGRGGTGRVWRARQDGLEREVAVKTLRAGIGADESAGESFRLEAMAAARLRHPGIVTVYEFGQTHGDWEPSYITA